MTEEETNRLFAQIGEMSANIRVLLEYQKESRSTDEKQDVRLGVLEKKVFFMWTLGTAALAGFGGLVVYLKNLIGSH